VTAISDAVPLSGDSVSINRCKGEGPQLVSISGPSPLEISEYRKCRVDFFFFFFKWAETESLGTAATTGLLYQLQMIGDGDCGEIGGMKIGKGNRSTQRKPAPAPPCPPQIPLD
jgi:hypothetical protein